MSSIARIKTELETLPDDFQDKVLAYIEYLKYRNLLQQTTEKSSKLKGIQEAPESEMVDMIGEALFSEETSLEQLREKNAFVHRIHEALSRVEAGDPGISNEEILQRIRLWQKR